ncbi:MAG: hypothetical protein ACSNEK_04075 [Parachlamydiaceae bacterium]
MSKRLVVLALIFCSGFYGDYNYSSKADKIASDFLKEIKKELKIYPASIGGGCRGEVNLVSLHLDCYQRVDLERAREIFLQISEGLFIRYNNHKEIRPYLHHFPFGLESFNMILAFMDTPSKHVPSSYIALIKIFDEGQLHYYQYDHSKGELQVVHKEAYTDAKKLIERKRK